MLYIIIYTSYNPTTHIDQDFPLTMRSDKMVAIESSGSELTLNQDALSVISDSFQIHSEDGQVEQPLLSVSPSGISISAHELNTGSSLGVAVKGPVEAALLLSYPDGDFRLRAMEEDLVMAVEEDVGLQAGFRAKIEVSASEELVLSGEKVIEGLRSEKQWSNLQNVHCT